MKALRAWLDAHPPPPAQARPPSAEVSYSQVRAFMECPWLYKRIYADRVRPPATPSSSLGVSIHRALEAFHRGGGGSLERLEACYDDAWVHGGFSSPQEQIEWHRKGLLVLGRYHAREAGRRSEILAVERDFLFPLGPHAVRGTIDRIDRRPDGSVEVIDYKTHLDVASDEDAAQDLQLGMYGLGARAGLGLDCAWLTWHFVAAGRRVSVPCDRSREPLILEVLERVADIIASGRPFGPEKANCPSCALRARCPRSAERA
jgi:DNA helicase-2/ATP-dependent DNA helicase PcrA